jgi:tRNA (guanine37-N1)-methyltransferase
MWVGVVSILPELVTSAATKGVFGRAVARGIVDLSVFDPRSHTTDRHRTVDDRPYGGGPGMVLMVEPVLDTVAEAKLAAKAQGIEAEVIYLSPQGDRLDQRLTEELATLPGMILLCGRFEGVDERVLDSAVDRQISIGDYVVSGGELPALVIMDAISRLLPGTLGNMASAVEESYLDGLLDYPHYTRPENTRQLSVPPALMSGDHGAIKRWRLKQALRRTWLNRPDLLAARTLSELERELLGELFESELE